jgi:Holliday junction resolvase RusA-like endonuclease
VTGRRITSRDLKRAGIAVDEGRQPPRAERMELTLPFPPTTNNLYRTFIAPNGKIMRAKTKAAKDYAKVVAGEVSEWALANRRRPPGPPFHLVLYVFPPDDGRKHDLSNTFKAPEDALMEAMGAEADDDDVLSLYAVKKPLAPCGQPRVEVILEGAGG